MRGMGSILRGDVRQALQKAEAFVLKWHEKLGKNQSYQALETGILRSSFLGGLLELRIYLPGCYTKEVLWTTIL